MSTDADDTAGREELGRTSRRGFLRTAVTTAAALGASGALAAPALAQDTGAKGGGRHRVPPDQISIQLYTLRDQLAIDLEGTLATLAEIGYTRVEHAGFVGRTVTEFKAALDTAGLRATSGHVQIPQPFDPTAWAASLADANILGSRYIVHPFFGIDFGTGEVVRETAPWQAFAQDLNRAGRHGPGRPGSSWATTTTTGSSSASPTTPPAPPMTSSPTPPTPTWSTWSWTCSGPPEGPATPSTSSTRTGAGSCSTTSRT